MENNLLLSWTSEILDDSNQNKKTEINRSTGGGNTAPRMSTQKLMKETDGESNDSGEFHDFPDQKEQQAAMKAFRKSFTDTAKTKV